MRTVGIKLADGSFYPVMEEGSAQTKKLELTTANDNQTCVMVDLYRSKTCSMDDAEYIDTLKIENLNAHQNGEPSISFDVGLDENGELSASIADPETGATSNSQITLVSRTAEERLVADDYSIAGEEQIEETSVEEPVVEEEPAEETSDNSGAVAAGVVAGAGLLAAAGIIAANQNKDEEPEEEQITEDDFTLGDDTIGAEPEDVAEEDVTVADDASGLVADDTSTDDTLPDMDFDIPEETEANDDFATDNTIADESSGFMADDTLTDDSSDFATDETLADDATIASDDTFDLPDDTTEASDDSFDLPDDTTEATDDSFDLSDDTTEASDDSFDLPDDTTEAADDSFDLPDDTTIPGDETILEDESFSSPQELTDNSTDDTDDFFNDLDSEPTPSPSEGLNFTGLYDKETEMGESSAHEEEDINKKTRTPVIICIVCAIICIIATILVLLVVPGKFNLRQKHADKKAQTAIEKPAETPAKEEAKPAVEEKKPDPVPQAKENEVVVIEKAEEVKPLPPPAAETKPKAVSYKIKWGDTLWDIADTYYKNPWRYKKIAKYNNIKNPDHIISGTVIQIPAE